VIAWELGKQLAENAIISCDSGTIATWWARQIPVKRGQMHSLSGNLATMACALPDTIAAQIANPGRQCVAFIGDGGLSMLMAEFATCVKYKRCEGIYCQEQHPWSNQMGTDGFLGTRNTDATCNRSISLCTPRRAEGTGITIEDPCCGRLVEQALSRQARSLSKLVDAFEPPMPPKISSPGGSLRRL
jgi:pyruvate dehydrogenase (quinone)/pyruvate oxidase